MFYRLWRGTDQSSTLLDEGEVETVSHYYAAAFFDPEVDCILDIGGQDMKCIKIKNQTVDSVQLNEACSSGCGSFIETFAKSLNYSVQDFAKAALYAKHPIDLGTRCTVFMNSSIITEQRNGKNPEDIMAGLCRSIIQNVFTKVIRVSNLDSLGTKIVVQGGTFENDAVLRAMEEYVGREVIRAPYPGIMGAIGVGLIAKEQYEKNPKEVSTWDLRDLDTFSYEQQANAPCPFCTNHCQRIIVQFSNGNSWVTNNRCEKGEIIGDPRNDEVGKQLKETIRKTQSVPDLFQERKKLLFKEYPYPVT